MGKMISVTRPDGDTCPAYLALPDARDAPGLVVIQEWWGLNEQIKKVAERFAAAGYRALVPDLYRGKVASDADEANHCMSNLDFIGATDQDIRGSVQHLRANSPAKVAVAGFCMGGALAILAGARLSEVDAGVCFYGIPPAEAADPGSIQVPMLYHFATNDDWCTPERVTELEQKVKAGGNPYELYRYDAAHAFMNDDRPEVYDEASARQATERTLAFLKKHLGQ